MTDIPIIDFENFGCGDDALRGSKIVMEAFAMALDLPVDFFRNCQHGETSHSATCIIRYRSTPHRVKPAANPRDRYSIAYFVDPDTDTAVSAFPSCVADDNPPRYPDTTAGAYVAQRIAESNKLTG